MMDRKIQYLIISIKKQMMNYLTMMPNYYCVSPLQTSSYVAVAPQNEIKPFPNLLLLNTISQALNLSLRNYEQQLTNSLNSRQAEQKQVVQSKKKTNNSEKVIEIIISEEEQGENLKNQVNQHSIKTTPKQTLLIEKNTNLTLQLPTDDSNLLQSKETCNKKDNDSKKKNRKNRIQNKIDTFEVAVPEIDLIETAYLPSLQSSFNSLAKKREDLLNRRVGDWNDFVKGKKERREIRMLGN